MTAFERKPNTRGRRWPNWYECPEVLKYIIIQSVLWILILGLVVAVLFVYEYGKETANHRREYFYDRTEKQNTME